MSLLNVFFFAGVIFFVGIFIFVVVFFVVDFAAPARALLIALVTLLNALDTTFVLDSMLFFTASFATLIRLVFGFDNVRDFLLLVLFEVVDFAVDELEFFLLELLLDEPLLEDEEDVVSLI